MASADPYASVDLTGRRAVITGANTGLGFATADALLAHGAEVVLAVRDVAKGEGARVRLLHRRPSDRVRIAALDLADLDSVAAFAADQVAAGPLDLLINNAGQMLIPTRQLTRHGFEQHFGVNHLGHFALTAQLLPALLAAPAARIVSVSSMAARMTGAFDPGLGLVGPYSPMGNYAQSKLANALFGFELDRRLKTAGLSAISIVAHPGYSATELVTRQPNRSVVDRISAAVTPWVGSSPAHGALSQIRAALDPTLVGGEFIGPRFRVRGQPRLERPPATARSESSAALLWQLSEQVTGVSFPVSPPSGSSSLGGETG